MELLILLPVHPLPGPDVLGGKAHALGRCLALDLPVPVTAAIPAAVHLAYLRRTGLDRVLAPLLERDLASLRWEAIWDHALRIRHLHAVTPLPPDMAEGVVAALRGCFGDLPLALRSSAPWEDGAEHAHAGLHDSRMPVSLADVPAALPLVWASLWSDRALLYRRELGLDHADAAMAVCVQPHLAGEWSGVAFSRHPARPDSLVVEAVPGQGQSLVDGQADPQRFRLDRTSLAVRSRRVPPGQAAMPEAVGLAAASLALRLESLWGQAVDLEWTWLDGPRLLQVRPVTAAAGGAAEADDRPLWKREDKRPWYRSLSRGLEHLEALRREVEEEIIPDMTAEAQAHAAVFLDDLDDAALAGALRARESSLERWRERYWDRCIPLAHGVRLLGLTYGDALRPEDPFEFTQLLRGEPSQALARHEALAGLAERVRRDDSLRQALRQALRQTLDGDELTERFPLHEDLLAFVETHGDLACHLGWCGEGLAELATLLLAMAESPPRARALEPARREELERRYLAAFPPEKRPWAGRVLTLARQAQRLRDDDNLPLEALGAALGRAIAAAWARVVARREDDLDDDALALPADLSPADLAACLENPDCLALDLVREAARRPQPAADPPADLPNAPHVFQGDAAGPGLAVGPARLVWDPEGVAALRQGEVLVCQGFSPAMSIAAPLAAAIVEERGGMLVHGAIVAREYGLPCVTGARGVMAAIRDGQRLAVNGDTGEVRLLGD